MTTSVITYRKFLNTDPPALVELWQQQKPCRSISQIINRKMLERMVFSKPYFDPDGLILAFENDRPVGFIHVGFAPNSTMDDLDRSIGILAQIRIDGGVDQGAIANGLWAEARRYYQEHGTGVCHAGGVFPNSPFYVGLYGGSRIPGIPDDDESMLRSLNELNFESGDRIAILRVNLQGYRPPVNRKLMTVRRQYQVSAIVDPLLPNWWECCTFGWAELFGFRIVRRSDQQVVGSTLFWDVQPLANQWGVATMGMVNLLIDEEHRENGLGTLLVSESLRHLAGQGVSCVEIQLPESDEPAIALARRIGFEQVGLGREFKVVLD